jgi:S-adenosylmethionine:tRNA ribosyltransferase-isomerase
VVAAGQGSTDIFIRPGHAFRAVDIMLTNFHLPRSSLVILVAAFAGRERVLAAYADAVARGYRFYSYGDAMLLQ